MALELFKARQWHRIDRVFPLFPTLHSIGNTPNGRRLTPLFLPGVRHLASCFIGVISLVHSFIPSAMRSFVSLLTNQRDPYLNITLSRLLQPRTVYNALYLAHHEMNEVLEMSQGSKNVIANHLDKISKLWIVLNLYFDILFSPRTCCNFSLSSQSNKVFYYGVGDKWSPVEHYYQMKDMFPKGMV